MRDSVKESQSFYGADAKSGALFEDDKFDHDSDDDSYIDQNQAQFYDDLIDGKVSLSGTDPFWEMKSNLNASLSKLFNRQPVFQSDESVWEKPTSHGLHNSAPIIPTKHNQAKSLQSSSSFDQSEAKPDAKPDAKLISALSTNDLLYNNNNVPSNSTQAKNNAPQNTLYNLIQANSITYESTHKQGPSTALQQQTENNEDDEGEDDDDDDDGEYEYEGEEEDDDAAFRNMGGMSADLMALLGIKADPSAQTAPMEEWIPPIRAGLDNSDRKQLIHLSYISSMS